MKQLFKSLVILVAITLGFTANMQVQAYEGRTLCFPMVRTMFDNNGTLPIELTAKDSRNQEYKYTIGARTQEYLDLKPGNRLFSISIISLNKFGQPIQGSLDVHNLPETTRKIFFKDVKNEQIEMWAKDFPDVKSSTVTGQLAALPASVTTKNPGDVELAVRNKSNMPQIVTVVTTQNETYTFNLPPGEKNSLWVKPPNCLKSVSAEAYIKKTGQRLKVTLDVNLACADRLVTIKDQRDHTELLIYIEQGGGLPDLIATTVVKDEGVAEIAGEGDYNVTIKNSGIEPVILLIKSKVGEEIKDLRVKLAPPKQIEGAPDTGPDITTVRTGCIQSIAIGREEDDAGQLYTEINYLSALSCRDHSLQIKDEDAHQRLVLLVDGQQVASGVKPKIARRIGREQEGFAQQEAAGQTLQKDIFVWQVKNKTNFNLTEIVLTDIQGEDIRITNLKPGGIDTPQVGCIKNIFARATNRDNQELQVKYESSQENPLKCVQHQMEITASDDEKRLIIELDGQQIAKSQRIAEEGVVYEEREYSYKLTNAAAFQLVFNLTDRWGTTTPHTLAPNTSKDITTKCIQSIVARGRNNFDQVIEVRAPLLSVCPQKEVYVNDKQKETELLMRVDGDEVAHSKAPVENKLDIKNKAPFPATFRIIQTDDKEIGPITVPADTTKVIDIQCIKQIFAEAEITYEGKKVKLEVAAAEALPCDKAQEIKLFAVENNTRLNLRAKGKLIGESFPLANEIIFKSKAQFPIEVTVLDDTDKEITHKLTEGQQQIEQMRCVVKVTAKGTNQFGQNLMVAVEPQLTCNKHNIIVSSLDDGRQLRITIDGKPLITSAPVSKEEKKELVDALRKKEQIEALTKQLAAKDADIKKFQEEIQKIKDEREAEIKKVKDKYDADIQKTETAIDVLQKKDRPNAINQAKAKFDAEIKKRDDAIENLKKSRDAEIAAKTKAIVDDINQKQKAIETLKQNRQKEINDKTAGIVNAIKQKQTAIQNLQNSLANQIATQTRGMVDGIKQRNAQITNLKNGLANEIKKQTQAIVDDLNKLTAERNAKLNTAVAEYIKSFDLTIKSIKDKMNLPQYRANPAEMQKLQGQLSAYTALRNDPKKQAEAKENVIKEYKPKIDELAGRRTDKERAVRNSFAEQQRKLEDQIKELEKQRSDKELQVRRAVAEQQKKLEDEIKDLEPKRAAEEQKVRQALDAQQGKLEKEIKDLQQKRTAEEQKVRQALDAQQVKLEKEIIDLQQKRTAEEQAVRKKFDEQQKGLETKLEDLRQKRTKEEQAVRQKFDDRQVSVEQNIKAANADKNKIMKEITDLKAELAKLEKPA